MLTQKGGNPALFCFMCKITSDQAEKEEITLFRSPNGEPGAICARCVENTSKIIKNLQTNSETFEQYSSNNPAYNIPVTPLLVYKRLSNFIVGQEQAKRTFSIALANHFYKIQDPLLEKSNMLIIGPSGSGKTELARAASKILQLPFVVADATSFTAHGYVGEDVESVLVRLIQEADGDIKLAQKGIVFIDEIDKLANQDSNASIGTLAVQQSLLKMIEGTVVDLKSNRGKSDNSIPGDSCMFDTSKVLFICAGAFSGLDSIIENSLKKRKTMGLNCGDSISINEAPGNIFQHVQAKHFSDYGFLPEFIGRFPIVVSTDKLSLDNLKSILTEPSNCIAQQYKRLFQKYGITIEFSDEFLLSIAKDSENSGLGARGLRSIFEKRLEPYFFKIQDYLKKKIVL